MTPKEYLLIEAQQRAVIEKCQEAISLARDDANRCPPPPNLRPAVADDIKVGAVVWYPAWYQDGAPGWAVVSEPRHYGDDFRAYVADDGCRYGLKGAFVEA